MRILFQKEMHNSGVDLVRETPQKGSKGRAPPGA